MSGSRPIDALRRFWWVVVLFGLAGAAAGGIPQPDNAADATVRWTASHTILVSDSSDNGSLFTNPLAFNQLQLFATTGEVPSRAAEAIDYDGAPAALAGQVQVVADQQSGALRITTTQAQPDAAVEVADAFGDELISFLSERQDELREARLTANLERLADVETELREAETRSNASPDDPVATAELEALTRQYGVIFEQFSVLQADVGQLVLTTLERAEAVPITDQGLAAPRSRVGRGMFGLLAGLAIGAVVALLLARTDQKIRTRSEAEAILGVEATATIPVVAKHDGATVSVVPQRHDALSDAYRTLRSIVAFADEEHPPESGKAPVTLVVSPGSGDGKTSIASNLSAAFAENGDRTLAINSDFRRPTMTKRLLGYQPEPVDMTLREIEVAPLRLISTQSETPNLSIVDLAGAGGHSPSELARVSARLLPRFVAVSDRIVVDTSPIGATAEVLEFVRHAQTVVIAVRLGHTSIGSARRAMEMIRALHKDDVLLVIVGGSSQSDAYYYYGRDEEDAPKSRRFGRRSNRRAEPREPVSV